MLGSFNRQHWHTGCRHTPSRRIAQAPSLAHQGTLFPYRTLEQICKAANREGGVAFAQHMLPVQAKQHHAHIQGARIAGPGRKRCCRTRALSLVQHSDLAVWTSLAVCAALAQVSPLNWTDYDACRISTNDA